MPVERPPFETIALVLQGGGALGAYQAGVMEGLMWRAVNPDGTLAYSFVEGVKATFPFYVVRLCGGLLYLSGMLIMAWNVFRTATNGRYAPLRIPLAAAYA